MPVLGARHWAVGIFLSAALAFFYARGGAAYALGFVFLAPWMASLDRARSLPTTILNACAMALAFTAAAFAWFGVAIGHYTQLGAGAGVAVVLLAAPLFQPQFLAFAWVRHVARRRHGPVVCALAAASAWVATEWLLPKMLGDTLGYGLYPSRQMRQAADVGGTAGLTVLLLLTNECVCAAWACRAKGLRAVAKPLTLAVLVPLALVLYGHAELAAQPLPSGKPLRVGLVQSNLVDYDQQRKIKGMEVVLQDLLNTHFAMSYDAIEHQHVDAVLWSETVYPLTFGHPKSRAGVTLDRQVNAFIQAAEVPFVFGTYDVDAAGEYNAAAFVSPAAGEVADYRKTRLFPFTEYVPRWLDGPTLRTWLPWTGHWRAGTGARVMPLHLKDGREIPVLPLICLDDVDTGLTIDGARLGAQAIVTLSNDSWFTSQDLGAQMHQTAAAFRSIETRLPQFRVTTNGFSAVIDAQGEVVAGSRMGERTLVVGELPVAEARRTLMLMWGDWVGLAGAVFLASLMALAALRRWAVPNEHETQLLADAAALPADVLVLPVAARVMTGLLRGLSRGALLWMAAAFVLGMGAMASNTLAQIRLFCALFVAPELVAILIEQAFAARASLEGDALVLSRGKRRLCLPLVDVAAFVPWRLPLPRPGVSVQLVAGARWAYGLAHANPVALARVLGRAAKMPLQTNAPVAFLAQYERVRTAVRRGRLDQVWVKFGLLSLLLALVAYQLHQNIAYGSPFGEYLAFGLQAYVLGVLLWWSAWGIATVVCAAVARAGIEIGTLISLVVLPQRAINIRCWLERLGLAVLYLGLPGWLLMRVIVNG